MKYFALTAKIWQVAQGPVIVKSLSSVVRDVRHGRQIVTVAGIVLVLALGGIVAIALAGLSMNRDATRMQMQLLDNAISQNVVDALNDVHSVAVWDVAAQKMEARPTNLTWMNYEIGQYLTQVNGHDAVWILDPRDRPIYGYASGKPLPVSSIGPFRHNLDELVDIVRSGKEDGRRQRDANFRNSRGGNKTTAGPDRHARWTSHVVDQNGSAFILTVMTVVPVTNQTRLLSRPYLLVSATKIGERQLQLFANGLLLKQLTAMPLAAPQTRSGQYVLADDKGRPILRLEWTARNPGRALLHYVLPLFIIVTIVAASLLIITLRRMQRMTLSLVDKEKEATYLANYDPLSSLPNRRLFALRLDEALALGQKSGASTTLAFCDIDQFKTINDTMGHEIGDLLIKEVARRLRDSFPTCVFVSRFGGDEFALMHSERWLSVKEFGDRIQQAFVEPVDLGGRPAHIGISVGIAVAPEHGGDGTDLMRNADIGLYDAKDAGRSRCSVYHNGMRDQLLIRKDREARILDMLEHECFELHYQPIVDIRVGRVSGMEALLRWPAYDPPTLTPAEFIPIAESAGLMLKLGDWVIRKAFSDSLRWPDLWVSINLSPLQIKAPDLLDTLARHLRASGADPTRIMFEITEGILLDLNAAVRHTLHAISGMGFKIGLDDFGTGYSSLSYLQEFTFDKLKIDRSFICDGKLEGKRSASLVKAVIDVGRALGIEVVAEGVEHLREAVILKTLGCDQIQGWLYGHALPPIQATQQVLALNAMFAETPLPTRSRSLRLADL
jgi:diguanylate cyclase (GGDEF)-like protein